MSAVGRVWTAPWLSDVAAALVGCGRLSGPQRPRPWRLEQLGALHVYRLAASPHIPQAEAAPEVAFAFPLEGCNPPPSSPLFYARQKRPALDRSLAIQFFGRASIHLNCCNCGQCRGRLSGISTCETDLTT